MPKYYCDYCDVFLTHDTLNVRRAHNAGWKHKTNVRAYYSQFLDEPHLGADLFATPQYRPPMFMPPPVPPQNVKPGMFPPQGQFIPPPPGQFVPPPQFRPGMPPPNFPGVMPPMPQQGQQMGQQQQQGNPQQQQMQQQQGNTQNVNK